VEIVGPVRRTITNVERGLTAKEGGTMNSTGKSFDPAKFVVVGDLYPTLEYFADPEVESGAHVAFVEAGDSLADLIAAAKKYVEAPGV
jgi:hypothetical protein